MNFNTYGRRLFWRRSSAFAVIGLYLALQCASAQSDDPKTWTADLQAWREKRSAGLAAPEGWLSLVGRGWLKEGDNSFGAAADNYVQLPAKAPAHLGIVHLERDKLTLLPPPGGFPRELLLNGQPAAQGALFADDSPQPSKLKADTLAIILIKRDEKYALRIKDPNAPTRTGFHGLNWFSPAAAYRIEAKWIPYNPPKTIDIPTVLGTVSKLPAPGAAEFNLKGQTFRLEPVLEEPTSKELFFILRDTTSKTTTYGAGRFLYTDLPDHGLDQPGHVVLDFNRLINPPCAFTAFATCPLPPPQNRLNVAIPAGEKRYHE